MTYILKADGSIETSDWTLVPYPDNNKPKPLSNNKAGLARNTGDPVAPAELVATLPVPETGKVIIPFAVWQTRQSKFARRIARGEIAVWLDACEPVEQLVETVPFNSVPLIALDFPKAGDGRAYSSARLLRQRFQYKGALWAVGDVQRDYFAFMFRCGFDVLVPRPGRYTHAQLEDAAASSGRFAHPYQGAADDPRPLWQRVQRK